MRFDLLIKGGEIIDPATGFFGLGDVAVRRDRIAAVAREISAASAFRVIDAAGSAGHAGPDRSARACLSRRGILRHRCRSDRCAVRRDKLVDAGSAGAFTLEGLRRHVIERAKVRIAAFVNISCIGLVAWDYELTHLDYCDVELFEMVVNQHRDIVPA